MKMHGFCLCTLGIRCVHSLLGFGVLELKRISMQPEGCLYTCCHWADSASRYNLFLQSCTVVKKAHQATYRLASNTRAFQLVFAWWVYLARLSLLTPRDRGHPPYMSSMNIASQMEPCSQTLWHPRLWLSACFCDIVQGASTYYQFNFLIFKTT